MKKLIGMLMAILMLTMGFACAETVINLPEGEFVRLQDGDAITLWGDDVYTIRYTPGGNYRSKEYMLQVGESEPVTGMVCTDGESELFGLKTRSGVYFFIGGGIEGGEICYQVHEYGFRGAPKASVEFHYRDGKNIGELIRATRYGSFFVECYDITPVGAFSHEQEYVIASDGEIMDIKAVPAGMYPFGRMVEIKQDLPLLVSRENKEETVMLHEGDTAMLVAGDGMDWVYISRVIEEEDQEYCAGWLQMSPCSYDSILVDGEEVPAGMYIDGIMIGG